VAECVPTGLLAALAYLDLLPLHGGDPGVLHDVMLASVHEGRRKTAADVAQPFWRAPGTVLHDRVRAVPKFLVYADEIIIHEMKRDGVGMVFNFLAESICQPREPAHVHPHREVLPLGKAG
jgi:hypothetical protein